MKLKIPNYTDFEPYATEYAKMEKLQSTLQGLVAKRAEMSKCNQEVTAAAQLRGVNIDQLIEDGDFENAEISARYSPEEFAAINTKISMAERAIEKHQITLDKARNQVNPELLKDIAKRYRALVKKIAKAYVEIAELHQQENGIIKALEDQDIKYWGVMPRIHTSNIGFPSNEHAWIHFFFREVEAQGYLKKSSYL